MVRSAGGDRWGRCAMAMEKGWRLLKLSGKGDLSRGIVLGEQGCMVTAKGNAYVSWHML